MSLAGTPKKTPLLINKVVKKRTYHGHEQIVSVDYRKSRRSLRHPDGRLDLRTNPHTRWQSVLTTDTLNGKDYRSHPGGGNVIYPSDFDLQWSSLESRSYARFRGKLYRGSASLGVTLAGYKQAREMIVKRYNTLKLLSMSLASRTFVREAIRSGGRLKPKDAASVHLEVVFGWMPLVQDIHAAATSVIQAADTYKWIKASAGSTQEFSKMKVSLIETASIVAAFNLRHSRGAEVVVKNPNVWLAERAGLLNPASVAWDLVPWSFVVNMFLNTGQLVNSLTDFAGLSILNGYTTQKVRGFATFKVPPKEHDAKNFPGRLMHYNTNEKYTVEEALNLPSLQFRVPGADLGLAAIAASLFEQKFSPVAKVIKLTHRITRR